jgi:rubrerythrin
MRNDGLRITVPESYAGEYAEYLNSLVNSLVFKNPRDAKQQSRGSSEIEALTTGIQAEKDSIIFYSEVLSMAKDSDKANLEAIIREEKSHLQQLAGLKSYLETPRGG